MSKVKEGETTNDLFAFLTTEPNAEVGAIHPKAMPVILTTQTDFARGVALKLHILRRHKATTEHEGFFC